MEKLSYENIPNIGGLIKHTRISVSVVCGLVGMPAMLMMVSDMMVCGLPASQQTTL